MFAQYLKVAVVLLVLIFSNRLWAASCADRGLKSVGDYINDGLEPAPTVDADIDVSQTLTKIANRLPNIPLAPLVAATLTDFHSAAGLFAAVPLAGDQIPDFIGGQANVFEAKFVNTQLGLYANADPKLLGPLERELRARGRFDVIDDLKSKLSANDELLYQAKLNLKFWHFNRDWLDYEGIANAILPPRKPNPLTQLDALLVNNVPTIVSARACVDNQDLAHALDNLIAEYIAYNSSGRIAFGISRLDRFGDLIFNQPQLVLSGSMLDRSELVNARLKAERVSFEMGLANLLFYDLFNDADCFKMNFLSASPGSMSACEKSYTDYVNNSTALRYAMRISLGYERASLGDINIELPSALDSIGGGLLGLPLPSVPGSAENLRIPGTTRSEFIAGYGMLLTPIDTLNDNNKMAVRLDVAYEKEKYKNRLFRNNHSSVTATITFKYGELSVPFSIIHSQNSEFINDIGVNDIAYILGINYGFLSY